MSEYHGTRACYMTGCRRPECVEANRVYMRSYRGTAKKSRNQRRAPHGTATCYRKYGCREPECREAHAREMKDYRDRKRGNG